MPHITSSEGDRGRRRQAPRSVDVHSTEEAFVRAAMDAAGRDPPSESSGAARPMEGPRRPRARIADLETVGW